MWAGELPSGTHVYLFWKILLSQVQDRAGRRGWHGGVDDPCHPFSDPGSTRMPMRMFPRRRARSEAPPCDPRLPVAPSPDPRCLRWLLSSPPKPLLLCAGTYSKGPTLPTPHCPPSLELSPAKVRAVSRLGLSCGPRVLWQVSHPIQFSRPFQRGQSAHHLPPCFTSSPSNHGNGSHFCEIKMFCISKPDVPRAQKQPLRLTARPSLPF